jgi:RNA polymerase sigma-70 factor (ECF subfamily)
MKHESDRTDEELARSAKRGDSTAYDVLVRRYLRRAMALAWQFTRDLGDAEDVVQEAFYRTVRALGDYDDARPFSSWFYAIVRNAARSAIEKDGRRAALAPVTFLEDEPPAPEPFEPESASDLERAIGELAPMQQACLRLCDIEGYTSVEASHMLGVGEGTVRTHRKRARERLRLAIAPKSGRLS